VADEPPRPFDLALDELDQLRAQVRPVAGDREALVVAEFLDRVHVEPGRPPDVEQLAIGARRKAVRVREDDALQTTRSPGCVIFFIGS
jgi:hypothetical protein